MVHGFNQSIYWGERHTEDKFETTSILGDCYDETLFFWYLICGGALDHFPTLKTYITHAGGMAVFQLGRLSELNANMAPDTRNQRPLMDYMPNFYFDLDVHHPALRRGIAEVVGADRLLYGTNFGGAYDHGDLTAGIGLSEVDRAKIRSGNAIELLKLAIPGRQKMAEGPVMKGDILEELGVPPIFGNARGRPVYTLFRHADIGAVLRDQDTYTSSLIGEGLGSFMGTFMLTAMDGTYHRRMRSLLQPCFMPSVLKEWRESLIDPVVRNEYVGPLVPRGKADLIGDIGLGFPVRVIYAILGFPDDDPRDIAPNFERPRPGGVVGERLDRGRVAAIRRERQRSSAARRVHSGFGREAVAVQVGQQENGAG